ncbi:MAG: PaaI family thioesterase [Bacteroidales bacterium]|nr:PaaI family thioesterase [Bacteroidales bacterium]
MRKLYNPYRKLEGYNCFGCSPTNPIGLRMDFFEDGDEVICRWKPTKEYQGYNGVLHGGIQATLMDEIASWLVQIKLKTAGVTSKLEIKYKKPVIINKGDILLKAILKEMKRNIAVVDVKLFDGENVLCSTAIAQYFTFTTKKAGEEFDFPDYKEFFEE